MKKLLLMIGVAGALISCKEETKRARPHEPWVFRSVLDVKPRMVTAALSDDIWVAYDAQRGSLYKAWKGGVNFDGAVYTTVHGPQPTSKGYAYYTDTVPDIEWIVKVSDDVFANPSFQYKGHKFVNDQVVFMYELSAFDQTIAVEEIPEALKRGSQNGLVRSFNAQLPDGWQLGLKTTLTSLVNERDYSSTGIFEVSDTKGVSYDNGSVMNISGTLWLNQSGQTDLKIYFHPGFRELNSPVIGQENEEELAGAAMIESSDCHACHNAEVKTIGPAYLAVARKYSDSEESVAMLASKVIKGGSGVWGDAMMTPHPALKEDDAKEIIRYILSLDDHDKGSDASAWHLGEKTVPMRLAGKPETITSKQPGLMAYQYLFSGDMANFAVLKSDKEPIGGALIPRVHVRDRKDFGGPEERFAVLIKGNLKIDKTGSYSFRLQSDDGSKLFLDGKEIVTNWGLHGTEPKDGETYLEAGAYPLEIQYFQGGGGGTLSFQWFNKEIGAFEVVPESMLFVTPDDFMEIKPQIPEHLLVKSIPGDKQWLADVHPAFDLFQARPDSFQPRVGGIDFLSEDEMLVCTWDSLGPVYKLSNFHSEDPSQIKVQLIASGLAEPLGIKVVDGEIFVLQKQELTKLIDNDGDGIIDEYQTVADSWTVSANFHEFSFGLTYKDGYFYGALATDILPGGASANPMPKDRGKAIRISKATGEVEFLASGLRTPNGIGIGVDNEVFVADNQGDWLPGSKINHVRKGAWYGSRSVDFAGTEGKVQDEPVVWLVQDEIGNSPSTPLYMDKGPYAGQMIHCEVTHGGVKRVFVEKINDNYQGCVYRFSQGIEAGVNRLAWAPDGSLLLGGIGVSGNWGQTGKLNYGLQRMVYNGRSVFEMLKVSAKTNGFEIVFTEPIKDGQQISAEDFLIERFYLKPTANYGGPKMDLTELKPKHFYLSEDRKKVFLELDGLKEKHIIYIRIQHPFVSEKDHELWTTEAWYTLTNIPKDNYGFTNEYAVSHNTLSDEERTHGWKLLFDGKSTNGIRNYNSDKLGSKWQASNGTLYYAGKGNETGWQSVNGGDVIITDKPYKNYELSIDWKISEEGNSGLIYNVQEGDYNYAWETGMEYQLLDNLKNSDGQIHKHRAGDLYDLIPTKFVTVNPTGEWNRTRLIINKGHVEHWLNGYKVVEYNLATPEWDQMIKASKFNEMPDYGKADSGHIVLQDHGYPVWFRNIRIREL